MAIKCDILQGGTNNHGITVDDLNAFATDFVSDGVVGAIANTSGISPQTGAFAVNAQGTPNMTVAVTAGTAYVTGTPTSGVSQRVRVVMDANQNVTIASNATGSTRYDWIYIKLDPAKMKDPAVDATDVVTLVVSRSTSSSVDNGTPPTYGYNLAVVTVANGAASIANASITDKRIETIPVRDASVTNTKLSTTAITLGYAEVTALQSGITTETDLTNLAVTVTVPTGGRRIEITAKANAYTSVGADVYRLSIKEGSTVLSSATFRNPYVNESGTLVAMASFIPTAGSHTYKLSLSRVAGTGSLTMEATSTNPAFILVKLI